MSCVDTEGPAQLAYCLNLYRAAIGQTGLAVIGPTGSDKDLSRMLNGRSLLRVTAYYANIASHTGSAAFN